MCSFSRTAVVHWGMRCEITRLRAPLSSATDVAALAVALITNNNNTLLPNSLRWLANKNCLSTGNRRNDRFRWWRSISKHAHLFPIGVETIFFFFYSSRRFVNAVWEQCEKEKKKTNERKRLHTREGNGETRDKARDVEWGCNNDKACAITSSSPLCLCVCGVCICQSVWKERVEE